MLGIFLTGFLDMVEHQFGIKTLDEMIVQANLKSQGIYTAIAVYDGDELNQLIGSLSKITNIPADKIALSYGQFYFDHSFATKPEELNQFKSSLDFAEGIESFYHVMTTKKYPKEYIPTVNTIQRHQDSIVLRYCSNTKIPLFMKGVFMGAGQYFNEKLSINLQYENPDGSVVIISIRREPITQQASNIC